MTREDLTHFEKLLYDDAYESKPVVYRRGCYICEDPDFAKMGLPLCNKCPRCKGHVAADDTICDDCGLDTMEDYYNQLEEEGVK